MGELDKLLKLSTRNLFPLPKICKEILETLLLKSEREFVELVTKNQEISSLILSVANQPKYRKDNPPIKDVNLALLVLGEDLVKILVLSFISTKLSKVTFNEFNFHLFWARAIANLCFSFICAPFFENFSPHLHLSSYLMDFGIIILYFLFPEDYLKVLKLKTLFGKPTYQAEKEVFGVDHATVGGEYFEIYNFPRRFVLNIQYHHQFPNFPEEIPPQIFEDIKFINFIDLGVGSYFSLDRERKFKEFKNMAKTYFNLDETKAESLLISLPDWINPIYELLNYKDHLLLPLVQRRKTPEEKLKEEIKRLEEQKKKDSAFADLYKDELIKAKKEKEILIEKLEELKRKLKESSILDPLTGLYNEDYFLKRLKEELLRAKRYKRILSVLLIEIDKFSQIMEFYGSKEEEKILKILSQEIFRNLRRVDIIAKLYNLEQFAIILPETTQHGAMVVARRLLNLIERTFYKKYNIFLSPYIVIVSYNPIELDPKVDPKVEVILKILKKGIESLKMRGQKRVLTFSINKELEPLEQKLPFSS